MAEDKTFERSARGESAFSPPAISMPKGGGAIRGIGEKFAANPVTGTGSMTVPLAVSPGRSGFGPSLSLSYDSGAGNGPFGFGWTLSLPSIMRKTDKGLPQYRDADQSDVFILSGAEDLTPVLVFRSGSWQRDTSERTVDRVRYRVEAYRPRTEGLFARIECWTNIETRVAHWRSISRDNVTTLYGKDNNSRIFDSAEADPNNPIRIFSWLICESYDDRGNAIVYEYAEENGDGVDVTRPSETNRTAPVRSTNRYLKRISYGNTVSRQVSPKPANPEWMFEVVFDYGEHDRQDPKPDGVEKWLCRNDPFSSYRAGFEIRTYRLCQRVLMFHHFPDEAGVGRDCLVRSTDFVYRDTRNNPDDEKKGNPVASFISSITQSGYKRRSGGYLKKSLPPLEYEYSEAVIQDEIREIDPESVRNLPAGLGAGYQWLDLDGEGISGILAEQPQGWFYKRNLGPLSISGENGREMTAARFSPVERLGGLPSLAEAGRHQFLDLAGDGRIDLVHFGEPLSGFHERTQDGSWSSFVPFILSPAIDWQDPNLKFIDLTGDGHADLILSEDSAFTWYPSLAEAGFGASLRVQQAVDEEQGPRLIFADGAQSIFLADFSGDGLTDLVRIRNGEVCYWPNLGYGRFGAKVTMDNAPWFDTTEVFDQRRIQLADIDGSGVTDIVYQSGDGIRIYFNQSGNGWSEAHLLTTFPDNSSLSSIATVDLFGNGTACLVWSSPLYAQARRPMRYIDLMGQKPHLLVGMKNNLGAETRVRYAPSTKFYLEDQLAGRPWVTRLPFPVHVVERVETLDRISRNRFVTRYSYHHGYFDGDEREFRGFGMVERWDTEEISALSDRAALPNAANLDVASQVPPVLTRTWFHTGAWLDGQAISRHFERDYYRESDSSLGDAGLTAHAAEAMLLADTVLPDDVVLRDGGRVQWAISADEARQACRTLKGSILRQETYALDGTEEQERPYSTSERNYTIELLQPQGENRHAVFFVHPRETMDSHYERKLFVVGDRLLADPRVTHAITLSTDAFGNVLRSVAIGYGRRHEDPDPLLTGEDKQKQKLNLITYTENDYTEAVVEDDNYRVPLAAEARTYELYNLKPDAAQPDVTNLFRFDEIVTKLKAETRGLPEVPYEDLQASSIPGDEPRRRMIERARTLYRKDDMNGALDFKRLHSRALPFETYKLAFTPGLLSGVYKRTIEGKPPEDLIPGSPMVLRDEGGYVDLLKDGSWWIPSGRVFFHPDKAATAQAELGYAQDHFFLPHRFQDAFLNDTRVIYDKSSTGFEYNLMASGVKDPLGNEISAKHDYRVLQTRLVTDPNGNRSEAAFDALGMVVGTAVMGKEAEKLGDSLSGFEPDLDEATIDAHIEDPFTRPQELLKRATTRLVYDLNRYSSTAATADPQPNVVYTLERETHESELAAGELTKIQHSFSYSDGFGREIQKKIQAEPGPVVDGGPKTDPRWVGSGWTIFNNKGNPIRKYEPFFSAMHQFDFAKAPGVSPILFYDPIERVIATLHPNHTYEKVVFDPWRQESWDVSDNVLQADPKHDAFVGSFFGRLPETDYLPSWHGARKDGALGNAEKSAALKAAVHANTPAISYLDTLGRPFLTLAHNRFERDGKAIEDRYQTRLALDIEGNQRSVTDARGRVVMRYDYDMLGNHIHQASMEAGERWMLNDVAGKPIYCWDSRDHRMHTEYDALRRPTMSSLREGASDLLVAKTLYGEGETDPEQKNLRGKVFKVFDGAGVVISGSYDFKGNLLHAGRQLAIEYKKTLDWSGTVALESAAYETGTTYDALNRAVTHKTPDNTTIRITHNEANLLEKIEANLRGAATVTTFVQNIDYNAKGQRTLIEYGNGARSVYQYDPLTFRLTKLVTRRDASKFPEDCPGSTKAGWPGCEVQSLNYTYDPAGSITHIRDDAQQTIYFRNVRVEPSAEYTYDAIYRLIEATGREHLGGLAPTPTSESDAPRVGLPHPGDGLAMGRYNQQYIYDEVGNILKMIHRGTDPTAAGWTRDYTYQEPSLLESGKKSNRLTSTSVGSGAVESYTHDGHGNMTSMPHLPLMRWNYRDQLEASSKQVVTKGKPETTYYVYDAAGERVRKVTEWQAADGVTPMRKSERIYLGGFEIYRKYESDGTTLELERETLHVMGNRVRVALIETRTEGDDGSPEQLVRYQITNHLGSAGLELDGEAKIISYEEYYPYGSSSYVAVRGSTEAAKRYRYTGKERDEENTLYYHGARYYSCWMGRWTSCDPLGTRDHPNLYTFSNNNPPNNSDPNGMEGFWHNAWETAVGIGEGIGNAGLAVAHASAHITDTVSQLGESMGQAYEKQGGGVAGVIMAANQVNPVWHASKAAQATYQAIHRGDYRMAGREGFNAVFQTVSAITTLAGTPGIGSRALNAGARRFGVKATATEGGASALSRRPIRTGTSEDLITKTSENGFMTSITKNTTEHSITLGYIPRSFREFDHIKVGITVEGETTWFHLSAPAFGKGTFRYTFPVNKIGPSVPPIDISLLTTIRLTPAAANRALRAGEAGLGIGEVRWTLLGYNCSTTGRTLLGEAGVSTPFWARNPVLLHLALRSGETINNVATAATGTAAAVTGHRDEVRRGERLRN